MVRQINDLVDDFGADLVVLDPAVPLGLVGPSLKVPYDLVLHGAEVTIPGRLPGSKQALAYHAQAGPQDHRRGRVSRSRGGPRRSAGRCRPPWSRAASIPTSSCRCRRRGERIAARERARPPRRCRIGGQRVAAGPAQGLRHRYSCCRPPEARRDPTFLLVIAGSADARKIDSSASPRNSTLPCGSWVACPTLT